ncbi:MAG: hypothetical protein ACHQ50_13830 [Fimbriimonadales bacterium]
MARGWQSKSVESQMESFETERGSAGTERSTTEQLALGREKGNLLLSRTRVLHEIEQCQNPGYRQILKNSLVFLEGKLALFD